MKNTNIVDDADSISFYFSEIHSCMREKDFQREFFESLEEGFENYGTLTESQFEALKRIYERVTQ